MGNHTVQIRHMDDGLFDRAIGSKGAGEGGAD